LNADEILRGLRYEQKKRENDFVGTCRTDISAMCKDAADCIESLQAQLTESRNREQAAITDLNYFASALVTGEPCNRCRHNPNDMGCELDGSQFYDDGECRFEWCGPGEVRNED
jgi:hypothetical protein